MSQVDPPVETIRSMLNGKSLLLTGSTGFLAKAFLEKVLRTIPEIGKIYLLVRSTDADHSLERGESDVFSSNLFDYLKSNSRRDFHEVVSAKIRLISGDTSLPRLGMSAKDYLLMASEIDLVVNAAASTDFMNRLDSAISTNALSTHRLAQFLKDSQRARLLHVSTCYVNEFIEGEIEEKIYPQAQSAARRFPTNSNGLPELDAILTTFQTKIDELHARHGNHPALLHQAMVNEGYDLAQRHGWNNVYAMTKWLGEQFLNATAKDVFCTVVRPSIVESCLEEPHAGWIEGWKVADPLLYALGMNRLKIFPARSHAIVDMIPVDLVANAMLVAIPELLQRPLPGMRIYQSCSSSDNPLYIHEIVRIVNTAFGAPERRPVPLVPRALWKILSPILYRFDQRARKFLGPAYENTPVGKILQLATVYSPYCYMESRFHNRELASLHSRLHPVDQKQYRISCDGFTWDEFLGVTHIQGMFRHVLRRPIPQAKNLRKAQ